MIIRAAETGDLVGLIKTFRAATTAMIARGVDQWHYDYPTIHQLEKDIAQGHIFVINQQNRYASISYDISDKVKYPNVTWRGLGDKACYIHRVVVHPDLQGLGLANRLCQYIEDKVANEGVKWSRLDSYARNEAANRLYLRLGYQKRAELFYFHHNTAPFYLYEKQISGPFLIK